MSNECLGWVKDIGKEPIEFEYGTSGEFFTAKGYLPIDELTEEFISKITYKDLHTRIGSETILGAIMGLSPIVKVVTISIKDLIEGNEPPKEDITYRKDPISYSIEHEKESQRWYIEIVGMDEYAVKQGAKRINNRLS